MWIKWILAFALSAPAWAYRLTVDFENGFYWATLPIGITVMDQDAERKSTIERLSESAIREWESRTGLSLWDFKKSDGSAASNNLIRWSDNFAAETRMDPTSVLAVAIRHTNGPYFARTEIVINGSHYLNRDLNHLLTTITHELGHTMGLDHSDVSLAIMAPTLQNHYQGLHWDDVEGMSAAHDQTKHRQLTGYISPLAYEQEESTSQPLSCGTVGAAVPGQGLVSLALGILIGFVRRIFSWFKSLL